MHGGKCALFSACEMVSAADCAEPGSYQLKKKSPKASGLYAAVEKRLQDYLLVAGSEAGEGLPLGIVQGIEEVIRYEEKTYRYMMFVGLLVAVTDPKLHPRCLQVKSGCEGAYNPRTLCSDVVVPFEKKVLKGRLGGSRDPYVSNPARNPMIEKTNKVKGADDKHVLELLYDVLEYARLADATIRKKMFCYAYRLVLERPAVESSLIEFEGLSASDLKAGDFYDFLESHTQGVSAVVILAACLKRKNIGVDKIEVHPITESGASSREVGDIDLKMKDGRIVAVEVKDKPYKDCDVDHACEKALKAGVHHVAFAFGPMAEKNRPQDGVLRNYWMEKGVKLTFVSITCELGMALFVAGEEHYGEFVTDMGQFLVGMNAPDDVIELFKKTFEKEAV